MIVLHCECIIMCHHIVVSVAVVVAVTLTAVLCGKIMAYYGKVTNAAIMDAFSCASLTTQIYALWI